MPTEWTDKGFSSFNVTVDNNPPILDFQCLLALRDIVKTLGGRKKGLTNDKD